MKYSTYGVPHARQNRDACLARRLRHGRAQPVRAAQRIGTATADGRRCLDLGVNLFDAHEGEGYGSSERILGEALRGVPRDSYYLVTKWAYHRNGGVGQNAVALTASVERSLTRRGVERIDVMMLHGILAAEYDAVVERFMPTLERLQKQGKIGFKGFQRSLHRRPGAKGASGGAANSSRAVWDVIMLKCGILN